MTLKLRYKAIILLLTATIAWLLITVVTLTLEKGKIQHNSSILREKVNRLEEKIGFYTYVEKVFKLKYGSVSEIAQIVYWKSKKYNFDPYLIMALIEVESGFNPKAVSSAGAYGLMQVLYAVWKDELRIDFNRIFDKNYNIELGLKILKHYYDEASGDMNTALNRYNGGYKFINPNFKGKIMANRLYSHREEKNKELQNNDPSLQL